MNVKIPLLFVVWLVGTFFGLPVLLASWDIPAVLADLMVGGVLLLPVTVLVALKGTGLGSRRRKERVIVFGASAALCLAMATWMLFINAIVAGVTFFYAGLFQLAIMIATIRSVEDRTPQKPPRLSR